MTFFDQFQWLFLIKKVNKSLLNQNLDLVEDPVLRALKHYENYPSIKEIERNLERRNCSFSFATFTAIEQQLKNLNPNKASRDTNIPTRILKKNSDLISKFVLKNYNEVTITLTFPNILKHGNVIHAQKKASRNKVQLSPCEYLSNLSKVYEKCLFNEMTTHFDNILSKYQCAFGKGFSFQ